VPENLFVGNYILKINSTQKDPTIRDQVSELFRVYRSKSDLSDLYESAGAQSASTLLSHWIMAVPAVVLGILMTAFN
jgi:hypothetical protein